MGVLNVTPDSFSDGGRYASRRRRGRARAGDARRGRRPDRRRRRVDPSRRRARRRRREARRVLPVINALAAEGVAISVDTYRASVAEAALAAGAIGDQRRVRRPGRSRHGPGGARRRLPVDPDALARAQRDHAAARARTTTSSPTCGANCCERVDAAVAAGVESSRLVLDPGLGFAKTAAHNWALLAQP